ncbi:MAG: hypothetical protein BGO21_09820 [Dyadobacter sp. 50-39]|uniref:hypothetical protein n=1 Tax=Dyadobacter sp. 50-39 TaxID=1895756 RepID=UPI000958E5D4|nr:hypothetical protein [Dyadobacter sp. 50-39]OJV21167.1 MAG: hypothetical protein BGO21_09820 [Dyadobacter sp. 50-39]
MKPFILLLLILGAQIGRAQDSLQTNIPVHDPVMIRQDGVYYVFATGRERSKRHLFSKNLIISTCLPPMIIVAGVQKALTKCVDYLVFHGYDAKDKGRSKLRVEQ